MMKQQWLLQLDQEYEEEDLLLKRSTEYLKAQPDVKVIRICDRYNKGYSDLFLCVNGIFCVIELKDKDGKPSAHQLLFIDDIIRHGGVGGVARTMGQVLELLKKARNKHVGC